MGKIALSFPKRGFMELSGEKKPVINEIPEKIMMKVSILSQHAESRD
jgi:hypothetical protein